MKRNEIKKRQRTRRKTGIRKRVIGLPDRPRLTIYRSLNHVYAQVIDDLAGRTLVSASTKDKVINVDHGGNCEAAKKVGVAVAERAKEAGVTRVVFDRNGYRYHGRVKVLADAAREGGLEF